jgi:hypothetical protein
MLGTILSVVVAVAVGYAIFRVGIAVLKGMVRPMPEPPPPGELRRVKLRYRCIVCGMELRVTAAANEDPIPPRHCMDEMDLVATGDE